MLSAAFLWQVSHFELQWRREGDDVWLRSEASSRIAEQRARVASLGLGGSYWFRVRSVHRAGVGSDFACSMVAAMTAPPPPEAHAQPDGTLHVLLQPVALAHRYEVQWRRAADDSVPPTPAGSFAPAELDGGSLCGSLVDLAVSARGMVPGGRYQLRVRAAAADGAASPFSGPSAPVARPFPPPPELAAATAAAAAAVHGEAAAHAAATPSAGAAAGPEADLATNLAKLLELGIGREQALRALQQSGGQSVAAAVEWHFAHGGG